VGDVFGASVLTTGVPRRRSVATIRTVRVILWLTLGVTFMVGLYATNSVFNIPNTWCTD
jgi:hypothetical protein